MATKFTPECLARINSMFHGIQDLLEQLYDRWRDEREYEDIKDYQKVLAEKLPEGFTMIRATKRPFGFQVSVEGGTVQVFCGAQAVGWKQIA